MSVQDVMFPVLDHAALERDAALSVAVMVKASFRSAAALDPRFEGFMGMSTVQELREKMILSWSELLEHDLVTVYELATAIVNDAVGAVFGTAVRSAAKGNTPVWPRCRYCAELEGKLCDVQFASVNTIMRDVSISAGNISVETLLRDEIEKRDTSTKLKDDGNACYAAHNYDGALTRYREALDRLGKPKIAKSNWPLASVLLSNTAQVHIMRQEWAPARRVAATALKFDPRNTKAEMRLHSAEAHLMRRLGSIEEESRKDALKGICAQQ